MEIATEEGIRLGNTIGFDPAAINAQAVDWARAYSFELVKELTETSREVISRSIASFFSTPGMTRGDLVKLLDPAFGKVRAEMIAVTETTRAFSQAQNAYQGHLSEQGIEMERVWRTASDELVCPVCAPLNGLPEEDWKGTYPDGPPRHPRCRCSTTLRIPVNA